MADPPRITTQQVTVAIGGTAVCRVDGDPPVTPAPPDPTRQVSPDATGLYEAEEPDPEKHACRIVQLNQAGRALVGWMTLPPAFVDRQRLADFPVYSAVLLADLDPRLVTLDGVQFSYQTCDTIEGVDPDLVLSPFQPWDRNHPPSLSELAIGTIKIEPTSGAWDDGSPKLCITLTFTLADGSTSPPLRCFQQSTGARPAERTIAFQDDSLKRALITRNRYPIPSTFFDVQSPRGSAWAKAQKLFEQESSGPLALQIRRYMLDADTSGPDGSTRRALARAQLQALLSFPWDGSDHAKLLNMLLTRAAVNNQLTVDETRSYREWLSLIAAKEVANQKLGQTDAQSNGAAVDPKTVLPTQLAYPAEFGKVMAGTQMYRYDFAFSAVSGEASILPYLKGCAAVFSLSVRVFSCEFPSDGHTPRDDEFVPLDNTDKKYFGEYFGTFFEMKAGTGGPPKLPKTISLYSGDLVPASAFDSAFFELYALDASVAWSLGVKNPLMAPSVSVASSGDTQLLRVHVHGTILEGTCAEGSVVPKLTGSWKAGKPNWDALKKIFSLRGLATDSDFFSLNWPGLTPTLSAGVSVGLGSLAFQRGFGNWMRPAAPVGSEWKEGGDARTINVCFQRDSADFIQTNNWDVRFLLETVLATDLALFGGVPTVDIVGFASPEYTPAYNCILAQKRANAVKQAILDAVTFSQDATNAVSLGDKAAVASPPEGGGLDEPDPTGDAEQRKQFEQVHQEQVSQWPKWRKVEINVRGRFFVHMITVAGDAA